MGSIPAEGTEKKTPACFLCGIEYGVAKLLRATQGSFVTELPAEGTKIKAPHTWRKWSDTTKVDEMNKLETKPIHEPCDRFTEGTLLRSEHFL